MVTTISAYRGELHCDATHQPSDARLATDAPKDNRGRGESFSPTDLIGTALGTCMLTTMAMVANDLGIDLSGAEASVEKRMVADPARRIGELEIRVTLPCAPSEDDRRRLEEVAFGCPVKRSLHPDIALPIVFEWGAERS